MHIPADKRHLKFRNGSAISSGSLAARVDCPNAADVAGLDVSGSIKVADAENIDTSSFKLSSCGTTKNNIRVLKEDMAVCSYGEQCQRSNNGELADESGQCPVVHENDVKGDAVADVSSIDDESPYNDQALPDVVIYICFPTFSFSSFENGSWTPVSYILLPPCFHPSVPLSLGYST